LLRLLDILCGARAPRLSAARHSSQRCLVSIRVPPCLISRERLALHRVAPPPPPAQISAVCTPRDCAASLTKSQWGPRAAASASAPPRCAQLRRAGILALR